jgi:hypothetical protein
MPKPIAATTAAAMARDEAFRRMTHLQELIDALWRTRAVGPEVVPSHRNP